MTSGRNILFPRGLVPIDVGSVVRDRRIVRGWSQERLARRIGVHRRTIMRLEAGSNLPGPALVHAIEEALGGPRLVPGWKDAAEPGSPSFGPRAAEARRRAGLTIAEAGKAAGISSATLSRFERELGNTELIRGPIEEGGAIHNEGYARRLGFADAADMSRYCMAADPSPWLRLPSTAI